VDERLQAAIDEALRDPEMVRLVAEVDRSLLAWTASLSPFERVRVANERLRAIRRFQRVDEAAARDSSLPARR
jgi:hypothetical protein